MTLVPEGQGWGTELGPGSVRPPALGVFRGPKPAQRSFLRRLIAPWRLYAPSRQSDKAEARYNIALPL